MANAIRKELGTDAPWISRLPDKRRLKLLEEINEAESENGYVDALLFTQFCDKVTIIKKRPDFPWSKSVFERELN